MAALAIAGAAAIGCSGGPAGDGEGTEGSPAASTGSEEAASAPELPAGALALGPANTSIGFVGSKDEGSHTGGFRQFSGHFLPPAEGNAGEIHVEIETASLWADDDKLAGHLKNPDFF